MNFKKLRMRFKEWMELFAVVKKGLEAHILMEEEDIFNLAQKHFSKDEAKEMAVEMTASKEEYLKSLES